ncbi:ABC transporter permease [Pseudomonas citronellolis]|uniref:ABC transporter permease n=1 Tax=Pseudomonas citronellolis TaxID=53408 RepID=UPI002D77B2ED|nr:ABC transporter permease [Pseudomonas citronellolis]WRT85108.1 ABC transporter permease [Pseudomonas citronellolis]
MNPNGPSPISLTSMLRSIVGHRGLIMQMTYRDVVGRYRGSVMGLLWSFLNPLFMLVVYTFVFSVVFKARWAGSEPQSHGEFAIILFSGMIVHSLFAEVLNKAPSLIITNVNYVKKVVFPLEILPIISLGGALFHTLISIVVLLLAAWLITGTLYWTIILVPLVYMPLIVLTLGLAWILASLGVYLRDINQTIGIITTVMLFLSPVFFPVSALPENYRPLMQFNPLTFIIEQARAVLVWGQLPDFQGLVLYSLIALLVAWVGYAWFQKTRRGFADVL